MSRSGRKEDEDQALPLLAQEIAKIPALLDDAVPSSGTSSNGTDGEVGSDQQRDEQCSSVSSAIKSRLMLTTETEPLIEPPSLVSVLVSSAGQVASASSELATMIQRDRTDAKRTLEALVEAGLVEARGNSRARTYTLSARVYREVGEAVQYTRQAGFDR